MGGSETSLHAAGSGFDSRGPTLLPGTSFRAARPRRTPKVGLVGALDRASGRHRHAAVDPARCPTDPRDAPGRTRAVPSEPDLVPAGLAAVAMDRRAAEDDPIPGTGPGCGGAVLLLHPAARVGLALLAGVRAHPVEPGVRARTGTERRFVRRRPVLQRIVVVHPRDRVGRRDRLDTSDRGHRGANGLGLFAVVIAYLPV